ncbi:hypothetical protein GE09DRAFT_1210390 [Coniochaeta sp. 2T2.1]|nr:hypothetical protein GE09DRAFT_1210390 [Coniochaeta sp. 2T2.1]
MAIIKDLGLAVSIVINDETVPEYDDPDPGLELEHPRTKVVNNYIESEDEIEENNALLFDIILDGKLLFAQVLSRRDWGSLGASVTVDGVDTGPDWSMLKRFKFSAVQTYDSADAITTREDMRRAEKLGLIRVIVRRAIEDSGDGGYYHQAEATNLFLAEKALKGQTVSLVDDERPYAIFNFKYRSRDDLRHEKILPRTPSPDADADVDDSSHEERAQAQVSHAARDTLPTFERHELSGCSQVPPKIDLANRREGDKGGVDGPRDNQQ